MESRNHITGTVDSKLIFYYMALNKKPVWNALSQTDKSNQKKIGLTRSSIDSKFFPIVL